MVGCVWTGDNPVGVVHNVILPRDDGEGFIELALVLILVAIVLIVILALLEPEITAFCRTNSEMFVSATSLVIGCWCIGDRRWLFLIS